MQMRSVTVVIPTYNGSRYIGDALNSVFAQTVLPDEIIVVDDNSTDGTLDIVREVAKTGPVPIRVIHLQRNSGGPARPMNLGMEAAATEIVTLLDQDDVLCKEQVELISRVLGKDPQIGLAFGEFRYMDKNGAVQPSFQRAYNMYPKEGATLGPREAFSSLVNHDYRFGGGGGTAVLKRTWQDLGGFNPKFSICWDLDFVLRLAVRGWSFAYIPCEFFYHRNHESNLAKSENGTHSFCEETQVFFDAFHRSDSLPPDWRASLLTALRARVLGAAYWERRRRHYKVALRFYWFALSQGISLPAAVTGILKLGLAVSFQSIHGGWNTSSVPS
jgi:glycosyltransferase involved in cell wall biosynthesis